MLETNIDDMNPELYTYVMEKAFEKGALDVFMTSIIMKKNRPGIKLSILCEEDDLQVLEELLLVETTTLGLRKYSVDRSVLERRTMEINTKYGVVSMKIGYLDGKRVKYAPEYEECRKIAKAHGVPIKEVYEEIAYEGKKFFERQ